MVHEISKCAAQSRAKAYERCEKTLVHVLSSPELQGPFPDPPRYGRCVSLQ